MSRKLKFKTRGYYHVYNRGVDKRTIFMNNDDYARFIQSVNKFNQDSVSIISYNLLPNHFHFELKQLKDKGISKFMHKLGISYTMYFNIKYNRSGSLFENRFKATHVDSEHYLIWLSVYIHYNSEKHQICSNRDWIWSSYSQYIDNNTDGGHLIPINKKVILKSFDSKRSYKNFVETQSCLYNTIDEKKQHFNNK